MNKSKAYIEAELARDARHSEKVKVLAKDLSVVFYLYTSNDKPCVIAYKGRSQKPIYNYRYDTEEKRAAKIEATLERFKKTGKEKVVRELEVGDVLSAMWGYEQTNMNYYLVTKLIGKTMVEVVEIGMFSESTEFMQADVAPNPANIIGEPMRKKAQGNGVRINRSQWATKESYTEVAGTRIYRKSYTTSYA